MDDKNVLYKILGMRMLSHSTPLKSFLFYFVSGEQDPASA
jgi:hypothetical protein